MTECNVPDAQEDVGAVGDLLQHNWNQNGYGKVGDLVVEVKRAAVSEIVFSAEDYRPLLRSFTAPRGSA